MNRRHAVLAVLASLALLAAPAVEAAATGFALTLEEALQFPPVDQWIAPDLAAFDAAVGYVDVFSAETVKVIVDPAGGVAPCDPTTTRALLVDGTNRVAEVHLRFPRAAAGNLIVFDKLELGADRTDVRGLRAGVVSGVSRTPEVMFEFGRDGYVYVGGQRVRRGNGQDLSYGSVWQNNCAAGIDNHITLILWHNLPGGNVVVDLRTHGAGAEEIRLGPLPMSPEVQLEGVGGMYAFAPPLSGRYTVDGMVCVANAPVIVPTGSDTDSKPRRRY